jgi:hypothetical protein
VLAATNDFTQIRHFSPQYIYIHFSSVVRYLIFNQIC